MFLQEKKLFDGIMRVKLTTKILKMESICFPNFLQEKKNESLEKLESICKFQFIYRTKNTIHLSHVSKNNYQNTETRWDV